MNLRFLFIFLLTLFLSFGFSNQSFSQDKVWTGAVDSSWHVAGNWNPSGVPTSSQTVSLRANTTPYPVITSNVTIESLTINQYYSNPGDELTIRNNSTLTITDELEVFGSGRLNVVNGHVLLDGTEGGNFSMNGNPVIDITDGSFTVGSASDEIDVEIIGTVNLGNGDFSVFGKFEITNNHTFNVENGTVDVTDDVLINGTFNGDDGNSTFNDKVDVESGGVINLQSGSIALNGDTKVKNNGTVNFGSGEVSVTGNLDAESDGNINIQDADVTISGDVEFKNDGNLSINTGTLNVVGKAELKSGGSFDLNDGNLKIGGEAKFSNGGTVNAGNANVTFEGDLEFKNGSTFNADSSTVVFSGDGEQEVKLDDNITFHNVKVDSGATVVTDGGGNTIIIENDLVVEEDASVEVDESDEIDVQGNIEGDGDIQSPNPFSVSATAPTLTTVVITFNKAMDETTSENIANYSIIKLSDSSPLSVTNAVLNTGDDSQEVTLTTSTITEDAEYEITMNNLESDDGGEISDNHKKRFNKSSTTIFYSRQNGRWDRNNTWSTTGHDGAAATSNPSNTNNATIIVGGGDNVRIITNESLSNQNSLEILSGALLRVHTNGTLTVGQKIVTGSGEFRVTTGTLEIGSPDGISSSGATGNIQTTTRTFRSSGSYTYNGTSSQITGTGLRTRINNLTIDNDLGVILNNDLEVEGTLSLTSGTLTIESGNNLIANTKSIDSGQLRMKQTISGSNGWRLLSSPIESNYDDFLDGITTQGYSGSALGNDPADSLQPSVLYYEESYPGTDNQRWRVPANASTSLTPARGLYTFVFGDIAADNRYNNALPVDLSVEGQEHSGAIDFGVTYTTTADSGWNLVGNPYAATIDWDDASWIKTNIDNTIYIWDYTTNQYKTWNGTTGDLGNGKISPFQGFWIKANATSPSLVVDEGAKTTGGNFIGKAVSPQRQHGHPHFTISVSDDDQKSSTHFMFSESANLDKDQNDAFRLVPPPGIATYLDISSVTENGDRYSINSLPRNFGIPIKIPIFLDSYEAGFSTDKELHFLFENIENIPDGWTIYLVDTKTDSKINLLENSTYLFSFEGVHGKKIPNQKGTKPKVTTKASPDNQRFHLLIEPGSDANGLPDGFKLKQNYPNPFNPSTKIEFTLPLESEISLEIFNILGQKITSIVSGRLNSGLHTYEWNASGQASGIYLMRLVTSNGIYVKKMTLLK